MENSGIIEVEEQVLQTFYQRAAPLKLMAILDDVQRILSQACVLYPVHTYYILYLTAHETAWSVQLSCTYTYPP